MTSSAYHRILRHPFARPLVAHAGSPPCQAVGGTVRDAILELATSDLDVSVARGGATLAASLAATVGGTAVALGGDRFASFRVVAPSFGAELWADIWDREGKSLRSDLERRDLTINSIACDLADGTLHDPCGGLVDLRNRCLRATRLDCFERDALRILRLARFEVDLHGFTIDASTLGAARAACTGLSEVAVERVRDELRRILSGPAGAGCRALERVGALGVLFPELCPERVEELIERADRLDRGLDRLAAMLEGAHWTREDRLESALALILALETAPEGDRQSNARASERPTVPAAGLNARGLVTRATWKKVVRLVSARTPRDPAARRLFLSAHGHRWPLALAAAWAADATPGDEAASSASALDQLRTRQPELLEQPDPLLDGSEISRILGIDPSPLVGTAMRALTREQILGRVHSRAQAEEFLRRLAAGADKSAISSKPRGAD